LGVFSLFFARQWWATRRGKTASLPLPGADLLLVDDIAILNIQGRMTVSELPEFHSVAHQALTLSSRLVIHLHRAEHLDSSAIGALVGLAKSARAAGGELVFANTPREIRSILTLLRLDTFFRLFEDLDSAIAALATLKPPTIMKRQLLQGER
jgi:N-acetylglucosaminyldiphosphoundecaprenol N-acetyl-beta-D-mannosaminyltransferase